MYISYIQLANMLNIKKNEIIFLSSDVSLIAYHEIENNSNFDGNIFLNIITEKIGDNGTLILPVYNWGFCKGLPFNYSTTPGKTGYIGNVALKRNDFIRTKHPIYSFVVWGKDKDILYNLNNTNSFGKGTVFQYLIDNQATNIAINVPFNHHYTMCHHVEDYLGVFYRYNKYFKSKYIDEKGCILQRTASMTVRHLELDIGGDASELYNDFLDKGIAYEQQIGSYTISYINIAKSIPIIEYDILYNNAIKQIQINNITAYNIRKDNNMYNIVKNLFSINRSLSGNGNRYTLNYLKENYLGELNIKEYSIKDNPETFDWNTPHEWNINDAYIEDENGNKIVDFKNNNLHILGYSEPVDITIPFSELDKHLYSLENDIDAIPYTTSYYKKRWGFCITHRQREELCKSPEKQYHVVIDSSFNENGYITYGELIINGYEDDEILISTYICHPSMANDNLSGIAAAVAAAKYIYALPERKYTYRIIFIPETIGALIYLKENIEHLKKSVKAGFVLSCIGDDGDYSCVHTPYNNTYTDKIVTHVLKYITDKPKEYSFLERGSDERQFCAPLVNLPVCTLSRTKFGKFKEYHTSNDNLDFVTEIGLGGGLNYIQQCINILENNEYYKIKTVGEPQLGKYGLYPTISQKGSADYTRNLTNIIAYLNGSNSILDIAELLNMHFNSVLNIINKLKENNLIDKCEK